MATPTSSPGPDPIAVLVPGPVLPDRPPKKNHEGLKSVLSTIAILIIAPVIALTLTAFVFQSYEVDGPSMETTLQHHDRLIVLKVPRTLARLTKHAYIPNRGDVIIFTEHQGFESSGNSDRQLIKRVLALPGERVVVKDGTLTVYNQEHPDGFKPDSTLPYGSAIKSTPGNIDIVVGENEVYVCGDNRTNSLDSRSFGPVAAKDIVGKLVFRVYPFSKADTF